MKKTKKLLSFALAVLMVISLMGTTTFAEGSDSAQASYSSYTTTSYVTDAENPESTQTVQVCFNYDTELTITDADQLKSGFSTITLGGVRCIITYHI